MPGDVASAKTVSVEVTAEDEDSRCFTWQCCMPANLPIAPLRGKWAEAHGVTEEEAVQLIFPDGHSVNLDKTPTELGWTSKAAKLHAVPAMEKWAEGSKTPPPPPKAKSAASRGSPCGAASTAKVKPAMAPVPEPPAAKRSKTEAAQDTAVKQSKPEDSTSLADLAGTFPGDDEQVLFKEENPKRPQTSAFDRYEKYKQAQTPAEALRLGAAKGDIINDFKKGFLRRK
eukprot:TRINITY_DN9026_c0_g1_i1.p1 TRINITY_DN9026_c0_g1~~TRINITY_DN9026_c0_g1_i1.p1  ORF type:complete len:228 (+),score=68.50 TRINITY_DN9026_c0_g1_i1:40-723(+)